MIDECGCCEVETNSKVSRAENGKKFTVENRSRKKVQVCQIDGCMINDSSKRCDFLFVLDIETPQRAVLVELKGVDHIHAISQLIATAERLNLKHYGVPLESYIVGSPAPKANTKFQKELLKQAGRYKKADLRLPVRKNMSHSIKCD